LYGHGSLTDRSGIIQELHPVAFYIDDI